MNNFFIAVDSFKGTLSSQEIIKIAKEELALFNIEVDGIEIADGGEGTIDAIRSNVESRYVPFPCTNLNGEETIGGYLVVDDIAIIEVASCSAITDVLDCVPVKLRTSFGTGFEIKKAIDDGFKKIVVTLGGSGTSELGLGIAYALGCDFISKSDKINPTFDNIENIDDFIISSNVKNLLSDIELYIASDVNNPAIGSNGCVNVFGPQKGIDNVQEYEKMAQHVVDLVSNKIGKDYSLVKGTGAAGGIGFMLASIFENHKFISGIETMLKLSNFPNKVKNYNLIITGEGKFDSQSLEGKAPIGVASEAKKLGIPVLMLCGVYDYEGELSDQGIVDIYQCKKLEETLEEAIINSEKNIRRVFRKIGDKYETV